MHAIEETTNQMPRLRYFIAFIWETIIPGSVGHSWPPGVVGWDSTSFVTSPMFGAVILVVFFFTLYKMSQLFQASPGLISSEDQRKMDEVQESKWERRMNHINKRMESRVSDTTQGPAVHTQDFVSIPDTLEIIREGLARIKDRSYQVPQKDSYALNPPEGGQPSEASGLCGRKYGFCRPLQTILEDIANIIKEISESPSKSELIRQTMASGPPPAYRPPPRAPWQGRVPRNEYTEPAYDYTEGPSQYADAPGADQMGGYMSHEQQDIRSSESETKLKEYTPEIKVIEIDTSSTHATV